MITFFDFSPQPFFINIEIFLFLVILSCLCKKNSGSKQ